MNFDSLVNLIESVENADVRDSMLQNLMTIRELMSSLRQRVTRLEEMDQQLQRLELTQDGPGDDSLDASNHSGNKAPTWKRYVRDLE